MAHILVVDDDYQIRVAVRHSLESAGHSVEEAMDGQDGIDCYRQNPADLVILDIILPKKNGLEVIQELQQDFPNVRILAISGAEHVGQVNLLPESIRLGALRAVSKPIAPQRLLAIVNQLLS